MGTLLFMLLQSKHETQQLKTDLVATQQQLNKSRIEKPAVVHEGTAGQAPSHPSAAPPTPAPKDPPVLTASLQDSSEQVAGPVDFTGDCDVSDQASVVKNLKKCIDGFNKAMGH
jgi:hypothetical protein